MNRKEYEREVKNVYAIIARLDPKVKEEDKAGYSEFMEKAKDAGYKTDNVFINKFLTFTFCIVTESQENSDFVTIRDIYRVFESRKEDKKARTMHGIDELVEQISCCAGSLTREDEDAIEPLKELALDKAIRYEEENKITETVIPDDPILAWEEEERQRREEEERAKAEEERARKEEEERKKAEEERIRKEEEERRKALEERRRKAEEERRQEEEKKRKEEETKRKAEEEKKRGEELEKKGFTDETTYEEFLEKAVINGWNKREDGEFLKFTYDWYRSIKDQEKKKEYSYIPEKLYKKKIKNTYIKLSYVTTVDNLSSMALELKWEYEKRAAKEALRDKKVFIDYASYAGWKDDEELIGLLCDLANKDGVRHEEGVEKAYKGGDLDRLKNYVRKMFSFKGKFDSKKKYELISQNQRLFNDLCNTKQKKKFDEILEKYEIAAGGGSKDVNKPKADEPKVNVPEKENKAPEAPVRKEDKEKEEADRKKAEEDRKRGEQEEADRKKAEEEDRKRREQEDADRKKAEEEDRRRREQEEADRKKAEEEDRRRREQEEADRRRTEEENRNNINEAPKVDEEKEKARLIAKRTDQLNAIRLKMLEDLQHAKDVLMEHGRKNKKLYRAAPGEELSVEKKEELFLKDGSVYYRRMAKALNNCIELLHSANMCDEEQIHEAFFELENRAIQYQNYNKPTFGGGSEQKSGSGAYRYKAAEEFEKAAGVYRMEYKYLNHELEALTGEQGGSMGNYLETAQDYKDQYGFEDYKLIVNDEQNMYKSYSEVSYYRSKIVNYMAGEDKAFVKFFRYYSPSMKLDQYLEDENGPRTMEDKAKWYIYKHELDRFFKDTLTPGETKKIYKKIIDEDRMELIKHKISSLKRNPVFVHLMESGRADAFSSFYAARMKDDSKDEIPGGRKTGKKKSAGKGKNKDQKVMEDLKRMGKNNIIKDKEVSPKLSNTDDLLHSKNTIIQ